MNPETDRQSADSVESATQPPHKNIAEGVDRMINEGGGVVDQNFPSEVLILRNDLVRPNVAN